MSLFQMKKRFALKKGKKVSSVHKPIEKFLRLFFKKGD